MKILAISLSFIVLFVIAVNGGEISWDNPTMYTGGTPIDNALAITVSLYYKVPPSTEWTRFATANPGDNTWTGDLPCTSCWYSAVAYDNTYGGSSDYAPVVESTGEEMRDSVQGKFDIVHFHSSLHHCDDPVSALKNAKALLKSGGRIYLVCEPTLHVFRSRGRFARMLTKDPKRVGHYGGNEHTYRVREYTKMLRQAGFYHVSSNMGPMMYEGRSGGFLGRMFAGTIQLLESFGAMPIIKPLLDHLSFGTRIFSGFVGAK